MINASSGWKMVALATVCALGLSAAGCAAELPQKQADLAQRIVDADTRAEHDELAAWYEQEAKAAKEQVTYHQRMEQLYAARQDRPAKGVLQMSPYAHYEERADTTAPAFVELCKSRVRGAEQAAADYLAFAKLHRQMAVEASE